MNRIKWIVVELLFLATLFPLYYVLPREWFFWVMGFGTGFATCYAEVHMRRIAGLQR